MKLLSWEDAHTSFESAMADLPVHLRGTRPSTLPYSPWQLVEHLRITQADILDFCRNPKYRELKWPDNYWPSSDSPPDSAA
ncbi:MAG: DinB family protein, partial [Gemmatimonadales bacterium]